MRNYINLFEHEIIHNISKNQYNQAAQIADALFSYTGIDVIPYLDQTVDLSSSFVLQDNKEVKAFYLISVTDYETENEEIMKRLQGLSGVWGIALGVKPTEKNKGYGKTIRDYARNYYKSQGFDYFWGYQFKSLNNIDNWLKYREILEYDDNMYVTVEFFN